MKSGAVDKKRGNGGFGDHPEDKSWRSRSNGSRVDVTGRLFYLFFAPENFLSHSFHIFHVHFSYTAILTRGVVSLFPRIRGLGLKRCQPGSDGFQFRSDLLGKLSFIE